MVDELTVKEQEAFRTGFLTVQDGQIPRLQYPENIKEKHYIRIVAKGFNHPKIQTPTAISPLIDLAVEYGSELKDKIDSKVGKNVSTLVEGALDAITSTEDFSNTIKTAFTEVKKSIEKELSTVGRSNKGTYFEFNTYVPGNLEDSVSASWEDYATDLTRNILNKVATSSGSGILGAVGNKLGGSLGGFLSGMGGDIATMGLYKAGKASIPAETAIFKSTSSSGINVLVYFSPRNKQEANVMLDTIRLFRNGTRPTISESNLFFDYPPIYYITICPRRSTETVRKSAYQKYPPMYLANTRVVYSEGNPLSTFFYDGVPTDVTMNLAFEPIVVNYNGADWSKGYRNGN